MNRRKLLSMIAATPLAGLIPGAAAALGGPVKLGDGYITGENGPELHLDSATVGVVNCGQIRSLNGDFNIDLVNGIIRFST